MIVMKVRIFLDKLYLFLDIFLSGEDWGDTCIVGMGLTLGLMEGMGLGILEEN